MANGIKGEVGFTALDREWKFHLTTNALVELEEATGLTVGEVGAQMANPAIKLLRTIFWAGLIEHHPEIDQKAAGPIMDGLGYKAAGELIGGAFMAAFPEAEAANAKADPRKAGTGKGS